jgi:hypothetical protein
MKRDRGFRRQQRERVIKNRKRLMKDTNLQHRHEEQENRYNKRHPYDCGRTDCGCCHPHKVHGCESKNKDEHVLLEKLIDKEVIEDSYKDQVRDEFGGD